MWGIGPTGVLVYMKGPWVAGALEQVWSLGGPKYPSATLIQQFPDAAVRQLQHGRGWYVGPSPLITANWETSGTKWTVPVGGGAGRVFKVGKLPINVMLAGYYKHREADPTAPTGSCARRSR